MEFRLTEKDFWHDRLVLGEKDKNRYGTHVAMRNTRAVNDMKPCTFHPATVSKSPAKVNLQ